MEGMGFFFKESVAGLVPRLDGGIVLRYAVARAELTDGSTIGTVDAEDGLTSYQ